MWSGRGLQRGEWVKVSADFCVARSEVCFYHNRMYHVSFMIMVSSTLTFPEIKVY